MFETDVPGTQHLSMGKDWRNEPRDASDISHKSFKGTGEFGEKTNKPNKKQIPLLCLTLFCLIWQKEQTNKQTNKNRNPQVAKPYPRVNPLSIWLLWKWNIQFQEFNQAATQDVFTQRVLRIVSAPTTVPQRHANALCALFSMNSAHTRLLPPYVNTGPQLQYIKWPFHPLLHPLNQILQIPTTQTL